MRSALLAVLLLPVAGLAQQAVQLSWTASPTPNNSVRVYRAVTCQGPFVVVAQNVPAAGPWNTVIPNTPGSTAAFQITGTAPGLLESSPSNCFLFTIAAPAQTAPPSGLTGTMIPQ